MQDISIIYQRRGGKEEMNLSHAKWLQTVQVQPDVVSMSSIPITSLLSGIPMSGFLNYAINLYLRCKQDGFSLLFVNLLHFFFAIVKICNHFLLFL